MARIGRAARIRLLYEADEIHYSVSVKSLVRVLRVSTLDIGPLTIRAVMGSTIGPATDAMVATAWGPGGTLEERVDPPFMRLCYSVLHE